MPSWLDRLLTHDLRDSDVESLRALHASYLVATEGWGHSVERASLGGLLADRLGYAFALGYTEALHRLVPALPPSSLASLCATEEDGVHPRAMQTTLAADGTLTGHKVFATLAVEAETLLVVAATGVGPDGRNQLKLVRVPARTDGVEIRARPATSFAPEISHSEVFFRGVRIAPDAVLDGDGFDQYLKPFRTIEDLHVLASTAGYVLGVARRTRSDTVAERLVLLLGGLRALADEAVSEPATHVALAGAFTALAAILDEGEDMWRHADAVWRARWARDVKLLSVAGQAREQRRMRAWEQLARAGARA